MNDESLSELVRCVERGVPETDTIAVAVSGGPDSIALTHLLSSSFKGTVHAITIDHALRENSYDEAEQVGSFLKPLENVRHTIIKRDTPEDPTG